MRCIKAEKGSTTTSFPPNIISPKLPLSISKVKWPTIRIRISCFPISRCHIFVKARPMAESRPRLQHPWINRRCGCDKGISLGFEKSHAPRRIISSIVIISISDSDLHKNTPDEKSSRNFSGHLLTKELGLASIVGPGELCHGTSLRQSFSSLCLVFSDFYGFLKLWMCEGSIFYLSSFICTLFSGGSTNSTLATSIRSFQEGSYSMTSWKIHKLCHQPV